MNIYKIISIFIVISYSLFAGKSIEINLSKQKIYAIENGRIVFSGSVSTGKSGHRTPNGSYKVIDKERFHISNRYPEPKGGAKMPYMLRLTNYGMAIHQGYLPGYPASHGCIRVSKTTAKKLWYWTKRGIPVKIIGSASDFKYVKKKRTKKRKKYTKNTHKKRVTKRRKHSYVRNKESYEVIEVYDSW